MANDKPNLNSSSGKEVANTYMKVMGYTASDLDKFAEKEKTALKRTEKKYKNADYNEVRGAYSIRTDVALSHHAMLRMTFDDRSDNVSQINQP